MLTTIRQLHRMLVDRIAASRWLRGRSGADASWAHYERHAGARARADTVHDSARDRAGRLARRGQPRLLTAWQRKIARHAGVKTDQERSGR
jgi:hypothetical protein